MFKKVKKFLPVLLVGVFFLSVHALGAQSSNIIQFLASFQAGPWVPKVNSISVLHDADSINLHVEGCPEAISSIAENFLNRPGLSVMTPVYVTTPPFVAMDWDEPGLWAVPDQTWLEFHDDPDYKSTEWRWQNPLGPQTIAGNCNDRGQRAWQTEFKKHPFSWLEFALLLALAGAGFVFFKRKSGTPAFS